MLEDPWATCTCFCALVMGGTVLGYVQSTNVSAVNLASVQASSRHLAAQDAARLQANTEKFSSSGNLTTFTIGDTESQVAAAQGPPREIWDGNKDDGDEGFKVWVYYLGPSEKDASTKYIDDNTMDIVYFKDSDHIVRSWTNHTGGLHVRYK